MPVPTNAVSRRRHRYAAARFVVRVGSEWSPLRAAAIWPIADLLGTGPDVATALRAAEAEANAGLAIDQGEAGMIAPPRPRRRRDRPVSSRAVFYHAAGG